MKVPANKLSAREAEVLNLIIGKFCGTNAEVGAALGISQRTVEIHRARIMRKLAAKNVVHLARIVLLQEREVA